MSRVDMNLLVDAIRSAARALDMKAYMLVDPEEVGNLYGVLMGSKELKDYLISKDITDIEVLDLDEGEAVDADLN